MYTATDCHPNGFCEAQADRDYDPAGSPEATAGEYFLVLFLIIAFGILASRR